MMNENAFRMKIGKRIITLTVSIFVIIALIAFFDGYADDQAFMLFEKLAPFKTIYITTFVSFMISNKYDETLNTPPPRLKKSYTKLVYLIVYSHFIITIIVISLSGLNGSIIQFDDLINKVLPAIEGLFGGLTGLIIPNLLKNNKVEKS